MEVCHRELLKIKKIFNYKSEKELISQYMFVFYSLFICLECHVAHVCEYSTNAVNIKKAYVTMVTFYFVFDYIFKFLEL